MGRVFLVVPLALALVGCGPTRKEAEEQMARALCERVFECYGAGGAWKTIDECTGQMSSLIEQPDKPAKCSQEQLDNCSADVHAASCDTVFLDAPASCTRCGWPIDP